MIYGRAYIQAGAVLAVHTAEAPIPAELVLDYRDAVDQPIPMQVIDFTAEGDYVQAAELIGVMDFTDPDITITGRQVIGQGAPGTVHGGQP